MKNKIKSLALILFALCFSPILAACAKDEEPKPETFSFPNGLEITLTEEFSEKTDYLGEISFESADVAVTATKEYFTDLDSHLFSASTCTRAEYAQSIINRNQIPADVIEDTENDLVYFEYSVNGKYYMAVAEKGSDSFWLCQLSCLTKNKSEFKPLFISWAKTITVQ